MTDLEQTTEIYAPVWGKHLGDCILTLNYFSHESYVLNKCVRISDHYVRVNANNEIIRRKMCYNLRELIPLIPTNRFILVKDDPTPTTRFYNQGMAWVKHRNKPFLLNKYQFDKKNKGSNIVGYSFDARGKTGYHRNFPSKATEDLLLKSLEELGFKLIKIGLPLTLEQCSEILSKVELLVCVGNGIFVLATTTRTPVFIVGNKWTREVYLDHLNGLYDFLFSQDYLELIDNIKKYKEDRDFYDKNCYKMISQ